MDIYVINLDKDVQRLHWMHQQLTAHKLEYSRIAAVNGAHTPSHPRWSHLGPGEIGCLLSHIEAWRLIAQADSEHGLVLEDDIHVSNDFGDLVRTISLDHGELCIHKLETFYANVTLARRPAYAVRSRRAYKLETNHAGTGAYIINRRTASHLLHYVDSFNEAIDTELFNPVRRKVKDLTIYQWVPAPCVQDFLLAETKGNKSLASNIAKERWGVRLYPVRRSEKLKTAVKARLRAVYTKLYSAWLSQSGRMRKKIEFK